MKRRKEFPERTHRVFEEDRACRDYEAGIAAQLRRASYRLQMNRKQGKSS